MARLEVFLLRSFFLITIAYHAASQHIFESNGRIELCFSSKRNQTGHIINKCSINNGISKLLNNMKMCINSNVKEEGGQRVHQLNLEMAVPPPRPASYELFPGVGYYKFYPDGALTYYEASSTCTKDGGHLAIIDSEAELKVILMLFARYPKAAHWAYIGFNDIAEDGKYVTVFGQPFVISGYLQWDAGQPDNADGGEDCGTINRHGKLNDLWCAKRGPWPFICEYDLSWDS